MNRITLLVALLGIVAVTSAQVGSSASECEYDEQFEQLFERDAYRLALRYLYDQGMSDTGTIWIDHEYYELMLKNLAIARNETSESWQLEVFETYDIHTSEWPSLDYFELTLDRNVDWVAQWLAQQSGSGNSQVDQLIKQFDLTINAIHLGDGNVALVEVTTGQLLNIPELVRQFKDINGVMSGQPLMTPGADPTDIRYSYRPSDESQFSFIYNWGNCEVNCLYDHQWICALDEQRCKVTAEAQMGEPLSVELFDFFLSLDVFPNPTRNLVNLHMIGPPQKEVEVCLFNAFGKKMKSEAINTNQGQLDVEVSLQGLPVGIYFVSFRNGGSIHTEKVLKL